MQFWTHPAGHPDNLLVLTDDEIVAATLDNEKLQELQAQLQKGEFPREFGPNRLVILLSRISRVKLDTARMHLEVSTSEGEKQVAFSSEQTRDELFDALRNALEPKLSYAETYQTPIQRSKVPLAIAGMVFVFAVTGFIGVCQEMHGTAGRRGLISLAIDQIVAKTIGPIGFLVTQFTAFFVVLFWAWRVGERTASKPIKVLSPGDVP